MLQPTNTNPLPHPQAHYIAAGFVHSPNNLMAGNDGHFVKREIAFDNVNASAANCADAHFYPDLTSPGPQRVHFSLGQRRLFHALLFCQDHRAHRFNISGNLCPGVHLCMTHFPLS